MASSQAELMAADFLALALEKESLILNVGILKYFQGRNLIQSELKSEIHNRISGSIGRMWRPQVRFLQLSTDSVGETLRVQPLRWPEVYEKTDNMVQKVLRSRSLQPLNECGTVLNTVITSQVDETQQIVGAQKGIQWRRHLDSGACEWCKEQVDVYEQTRQWRRHYSCRCFKVKGEVMSLWPGVA